MRQRLSHNICRCIGECSFVLVCDGLVSRSDGPFGLRLIYLLFLRASANLRLRDAGPLLLTAAVFTTAVLFAVATLFTGAVLTLHTLAVLTQRSRSKSKQTAHQQSRYLIESIHALAFLIKMYSDDAHSILLSAPRIPLEAELEFP
jgi:hypothetical protein